MSATPRNERWQSVASRPHVPCDVSCALQRRQKCACRQTENMPADEQKCTCRKRKCTFARKNGDLERIQAMSRFMTLAGINRGRTVIVRVQCDNQCDMRKWAILASPSRIRLFPSFVSIAQPVSAPRFHHRLAASSCLSRVRLSRRSSPWLNPCQLLASSGRLLPLTPIISIASVACQPPRLTLIVEPHPHP